MERNNITNKPITAPIECAITQPIDIESSMQRLQNNLNTMADRMQILVRALNDNMMEEMGEVEYNRPKPLNIKKIRSLKWAPGNCETCSICHDTMNCKAKKLACKHKFHAECIIPWLKISASCPHCRKTVE